MAYLPADVLRHCRARHSVITRRELLRLGHSPGTITGWIKRGYLEIQAVGVYRIPGASETKTSIHYAALMRGRAHARLGGPSALGLLHIDGFDLDDPPFVVIPAHRFLQNVSFDWLAADVPTRQRASISDLPSVRPLRALVEAAGLVKAKRVRVAFDDLRLRGLATPSRLREHAESLVGTVPGAEVALDLLRSGALLKESEGERTLASIFLPEDPQPVWQVWVLPNVRVDAFFPEACLAIEYQGERHHTLEADRAADVARAARLRAEAGIELIECRKGDLADPTTLRRRILEYRADRISSGVEPYRNYTFAQVR